jgi:hypothetical protein
MLQDHFHLAPPAWISPPVAVPAGVGIAPATVSNTPAR